MKNGLMIVSTPPIINIGDYIQALAAKQFVGDTEILVERERLSLYHGEPIKMIMNGWYMCEPQYWPPTDLIHPLFLSLHINKLAKERMLAEDSIDYLKKYEPIGCRDLNTVELLTKKGVKAYFSGCLTLTLGNTYKSSQKDNKIYFVDPYINISRQDLKSMLSAFLYLLCHLKSCKKLFPIFKEYKKRSGMWLVAAAFHRTYSKYFDEKLLYNAEFITQESPVINKQYPTNQAKFQRAEELIKKYSKARCVITSRIHCALPCLSLETPVIYIEKKEQSEVSRCRLNGLRELFNIIQADKDTLIPLFPISGKITLENFPQNKSNYIKLKDNLTQICKDFIHGKY